MAQTAEDIHEQYPLDGSALRLAADGTPTLIGLECRECGTKAFPPAPVCPECMSENVTDAELSDHGSLYTWSVVHVAPKGWNVPYIAGYVDLPESVRVFTHIVGVDPSELEMDMDVTLTTATVGEDENGTVESYAFTPVKV
ncbi:MAG: Zn-ribbon domain-containing OB-fold protein [Alphaproteobacteria bacterium]